MNSSGATTRECREPSGDPCLDAILEALSRHLGVDAADIPIDLPVVDVPGIDSMTLINALLAIERHLGISVDLHLLTQVRTIADLAAVVRLHHGTELA
ncbi:acyl carrier protein [Allokutzneria oryzae]|uniref:Acyl carrier protein n=1 Tax=Allokutzneria oryzae TaxID=1378989 RepID=A0ABV5ZYT9_9PSEU